MRCVCDTNIEYPSAAGDGQLCQKYNRYSDCFANIVCIFIIIYDIYVCLYSVVNLAVLASD